MDVIFICLHSLTMLVMLVVLMYVLDFNEHKTIIEGKMDAGVTNKEEGET